MAEIRLHLDAGEARCLAYACFGPSGEIDLAPHVTLKNMESLATVGLMTIAHAGKQDNSTLSFTPTPAGFAEASKGLPKPRERKAKAKP